MGSTMTVTIRATMSSTCYQYYKGFLRATKRLSASGLWGTGVYSIGFFGIATKVIELCCPFLALGDIYR